MTCKRLLNEQFISYDGEYREAAAPVRERAMIEFD